MDRKFILGWIGVILFCILIGMGLNYSAKTSRNEIAAWEATEIGKSCSDRFNTVCHECYNDCQDLGAKMLRYDSGGFGASRCTCRWDKEYKQIW